MRQDVVRNEDYREEMRRVVMDDCSERVPEKCMPSTPRKYKKYMEYRERLRVQKEFVDYAICKTLSTELQRQKAQGGFCEPAQSVTIEGYFPFVFPCNEAVLRETLEYIEERNLHLIAKFVNGDRSNYILEGSFTKELEE